MTDSKLAERTTLSFYRYTRIEDPIAFRLTLLAEWEPLEVLGRTYIAREGINAQVNVPTVHLSALEESVRRHFPEMPFKIALEERGEAFAKLKIKVRPKLVADGLADDSFDVSRVGTHLDAQSFHAAMKDPETLVVDLRNHYECEVGHFRGALLPEGNTFRDVLPEVREMLRGQENRKLLLYCTGGIRCEKASAWLRHEGFQDVNQLHGGIIDYARQIKEQQLPSEFIGKNFVFDQRMGERVTEDVIAQCHQCGAPCDEHTNCAYEGCNRLFLQCADCAESFQACCSVQCQDIMAKPKEERIAIQQVWDRKLGAKHYWSRTRVPQEFAHTHHEVWEPLALPMIQKFQKVEHPTSL